jgi:DNA polymerase-3 subunit epsilon
MIKGCSIDNNRVEEIVERANLIIAHNAGFDRKIVEKQFPIFKKKPWACTCTQIPYYFLYQVTLCSMYY